MPSNLTMLVHHLCHVSRSHLWFADHSDHPDGRGYHEALSHYWRGDWTGTINSASQLVTDAPDADTRFAAYRLWIDALAERQNTAGLQLLKEHLLRRCQVEAEDYAGFAALRAMIHLELDEFDAARLLARSLLNVRVESAQAPYVAEVRQAMHMRGDSSVGQEHALLHCGAPVVDYCHWQSISRALLVAGAEEAMEAALGFIHQHAKASPLPQVFEFHRCVERGFYAAAALVAARLVALVPDSMTYQYYQAYAHFEDGNYPKARQCLEGMLAKAGDDDAEVVGLLGHCHAKLGNPAAAAPFLRRASELLQSAGLPASHIRLELANVEEELRGDQPDPVLAMPRMTRKWLVRLSPRRYHEFASASDSSIDRLLRPMGNAPQTGDICFFAVGGKSDAQGNAQWKVVGIYAVDSEPMWHPIHRFHTALRLIARLPAGIPVDVQESDEDHGQKARRGRSQAERHAPIHYGVYELDSHAIDLIEKAVHMSREELIERRRGTGQSRRPTA